MCQSVQYINHLLDTFKIIILFEPGASDLYSGVRIRNIIEKITLHWREHFIKQVSCYFMAY
jgi:hypothetical protein